MSACAWVFFLRLKNAIKQHTHTPENKKRGEGDQRSWVEKKNMRAALVTFACLATLASAMPTFEAQAFDVAACLETANTYNRATCTVCQEATRVVCSVEGCPPNDGEAELSADCKLCYDLTMVSAKTVTRLVLEECKVCGVLVEAANTLAKAKDAEAVEMKATTECSPFCTIESCIREPDEFGFLSEEATKCQTGVRAVCAKLSAAEAAVA